MSQTASPDIIELTVEKIDVNNLIEAVTLPHCGAISTFLGTTRNNFKDKVVISLEYECYNAMALKQLQLICDSMRRKWSDIGRVAVVHRLGLVPVGEASVLVAVSSPHRGTAIKATEYCIEEVKASVPIWKKELYESSESEWKANKECKWVK